MNNWVGPFVFHREGAFRSEAEGQGNDKKMDVKKERYVRAGLKKSDRVKVVVAQEGDGAEKRLGKRGGIREGEGEEEA